MATWKKWTSTVLVNGQPEPNVRVFVFSPGSTDQIPIYEDEGVTQITQPILTDSQGRYAFFVDVDAYPEIRLYLEKDGVDFSEVNEDLDGVPVPGAGGGAGTFTELTDTPSSYVGRGGDVVVVKNTEDGIETQPWPVTGTVLNVFLSSDAADIGDYYYMYHTETGDTHSELTSPSLSTGNDQLLWSFVTEAGQPGLNQLALGAYTATLFLKKSGNKDVRVYWKLFKRDTSGNETEILESAVSDHLTTDNSQYLISAYLNEDQVLDPTDRLVFKLYANVSGTGTDVTVTLTMEGDYDSRLAIHVLSSAFSLDRLSDVTLSSPSNKEMLAYDAASEKWTNQTPGEAGVLASDGSVPLTGDWDTGGFRISNLKSLNFKDATTLTISSGAITVSQSYHYVDTEGGAASDDLDTINGGTAGDILYLRSADSSRIVVIKHGVGNIVTPDGTDYSLDSTDKVVALLFDGTNWHLVGTAGGEGGGAMQLNDLTDVAITSPADNELLAYDSGSGKWINQTPNEAGILAADGSVPLTGDLDFATHAALNLSGAGRGTVSAPIIRPTTVVVAASDSSAQSKAQADYVCDGVDDEVEIQAAVDALPEAGGQVILLEGTYNISAAIQIVSKSHITIRGMGKATKIVPQNDCTAIEIGHKTDSGQKSENVVISSLFIDGSNQSTQSETAPEDQATFVAHGIAFGAASSGKVEFCWVDSTGNDSIYGYNPGDLVIAHNTITNTRGYWAAIHVHGAGHKSIIDGNEIYNSAVGGIRHGTIITNNRIEGAGAQGGIIGGDRGAVIANNYLDVNCTGIQGWASYQLIANNRVKTASTSQDYHGIFLTSGCSYSVVSGNVISETGGCGIVASGSSTTTLLYVSIVDNIVINPSQAQENARNGIHLADYVEHALISGNQVSYTSGATLGKYAIAEANNCDQNLIESNVVATFASGTISTVGTNTRVRFNQGYALSCIGGKLRVEFEDASTSGEVTGILSYPTLNPTASSAAVLRALKFSAIGEGSADLTNSAAALRGLQGGAHYAGSGTVTGMMGGAFYNLNSGPGTVKNSYSVYIFNSDNTGTGSIENKYGLYIEDITGGTSKNYAVYSAGGAVYFGGDVGIKTTSPGYTLDVSGDIHCTGKLTSDGGNDPPYVLYNYESRSSIIERVKKEVLPDKLNGAVLFYNGDRGQLELFLPSKGEFRSLDGKVLETVEPITETFETEDRYYFDEETGEIKSYKVKKPARRYRLKPDHELDPKTGKIKRKIKEKKKDPKTSEEIEEIIGEEEVTLEEAVELIEAKKARWRIKQSEST